MSKNTGLHRRILSLIGKTNAYYFTILDPSTNKKSSSSAARLIPPLDIHFDHDISPKVNTSVLPRNASHSRGPSNKSADFSSNKKANGRLFLKDRFNTLGDDNESSNILTTEVYTNNTSMDKKSDTKKKPFMIPSLSTKAVNKERLSSEPSQIQHNLSKKYIRIIRDFPITTKHIDVRVKRAGKSPNEIQAFHSEISKIINTSKEKSQLESKRITILR